MLNKILVVFSILTLSACTTKLPPPPAEPTIYPWPTPMMECSISSVRIDPETADVILSYQDNVNIAVCERDMFRYIKDLSKIICKHQPKDKECQIK